MQWIITHQATRAEPHSHRSSPLRTHRLVLATAFPSTPNPTTSPLLVSLVSTMSTHNHRRATCGHPVLTMVMWRTITATSGFTRNLSIRQLEAGCTVKQRPTLDPLVLTSHSVNRFHSSYAIPTPLIHLACSSLRPTRVTYSLLGTRTSLACFRNHRWRNESFSKNDRKANILVFPECDRGYFLHVLSVCLVVFFFPFLLCYHRSVSPSAQKEALPHCQMYFFENV